jgi:mannose-6-phosphate isomerase-like protein (cupin superfamily)
MYKALTTEELRRNPTSRTATFEGEAHGAGSSFFLVDNEPGQGPPLHRHPYSETWVVLSGEALITAGDAQIEAREGDVLTVSAETPHKFVNVGMGTIGPKAWRRFTPPR